MKRTPIDFTGVTQTDWARLAAFIDGEGHIGIARHVPKADVKHRWENNFMFVTIVNTDPRLAQWLMSRFGGNIHTLKQASDTRWKPTVHWRVSCAQAADVLRGALPYFVLKTAQAEIALAFYATMKRRGVNGTPQHIRDERQDLRNKLRVLTARGPQLKVAAG